MAWTYSIPSCLARASLTLERSWPIGLYSNRPASFLALGRSVLTKSISEAWQDTAAEPVRPKRIPTFTGSAAWARPGSIRAAKAAPAHRPVTPRFSRGSISIDIWHLPSCDSSSHLSILYKLYLIVGPRSRRCQRRWHLVEGSSAGYELVIGRDAPDARLDVEDNAARRDQA